MAEPSLVDQRHMIIEALGIHPVRHTTLGYNFPGREIDPPQRTLPNDTQHSQLTGIYGSSPHSQQPSSRKPKPSTLCPLALTMSLCL